MRMHVNSSQNFSSKINPAYTQKLSQQLNLADHDSLQTGNDLQSGFTHRPAPISINDSCVVFQNNLDTGTIENSRDSVQRKART